MNTGSPTPDQIFQTDNMVAAQELRLTNLQLVSDKADTGIIASLHQLLLHFGTFQAERLMVMFTAPDGIRYISNGLDDVLFF